jgi:hypothetical protein
MNRRVSLVAAALFAIAILAIFALHRRSQRFPCPAQGSEAARQVLLEDIHVVAVDRNIVTADAFAKNKSPRALGGLIVETTAADGKQLVTEARNNERCTFPC